MADRDCVHGQLARVCDYCELEAEIAALRAQLEQAQDKFTKTILAAKGQAVELGELRAEFEKWVKNPHMLGRCHAPGSEDRYEVSETQYAWRAWQAAIAAYRDAEIERLTASLVHWKRLADEACRGEMLALKEKHDLRAKLEAAERDAERYRYLRGYGYDVDSFGIYWDVSFDRLGKAEMGDSVDIESAGESLDAAIDSARGGERG